MAVTVWNNAPKYADILALRDDSECSVAAVKNGETIELRFKTSKDGSQWQEDGAAVLVGTIPKAVPVLVEEKPSGELIVLDGAKILFASRNGGQEWEAVN